MEIARSDIRRRRQLARPPHTGLRPRARPRAERRRDLDTQRDDRSQQIAATALAILLFVSILLLWAPGRWAASLFQTGVFTLAIVCIFRARRVQWSFVIIPLAAAVAWGLAHLALGRTIYRWETSN